MLTKGAIEDLIMRHLAGRRPDAAALSAGKAPGPRKKVFMSDYELRKMLVPGSRSLRLPAEAIISPLALDWIEFNGIRVIRE